MCRRDMGSPLLLPSFHIDKCLCILYKDFDILLINHMAMLYSMVCNSAAHLECVSDVHHIREAIWIRRRAPNTMNRDEGACYLSLLNDPLLTTLASNERQIVLV